MSGDKPRVFVIYGQNLDNSPFTPSIEDLKSGFISTGLNEPDVNIIDLRDFKGDEKDLQRYLKEKYDIFLREEPDRKITSVIFTHGTVAKGGIHKSLAGVNLKTKDLTSFLPKEQNNELFIINCNGGSYFNDTKLDKFNGLTTLSDELNPSSASELGNIISYMKSGVYQGPITANALLQMSLISLNPIQTNPYIMVRSSDNINEKTIINLNRKVGDFFKKDAQGRSDILYAAASKILGNNDQDGFIDINTEDFNKLVILLSEAKSIDDIPDMYKNLAKYIAWAGDNSPNASIADIENSEKMYIALSGISIKNKDISKVRDILESGFIIEENFDQYLFQAIRHNNEELNRLFLAHSTDKQLIDNIGVLTLKSISDSLFVKSLFEQRPNFFDNLSNQNLKDLAVSLSQNDVDVNSEFTKHFIEFAQKNQNLFSSIILEDDYRIPFDKSDESCRAYFEKLDAMEYYPEDILLRQEGKIMLYNFSSSDSEDKKLGGAKIISGFIERGIIREDELGQFKDDRQLEDLFGTDGKNIILNKINEIQSEKNIFADFYSFKENVLHASLDGFTEEEKKILRETAELTGISINFETSMNGNIQKAYIKLADINLENIEYKPEATITYNNFSKSNNIQIKRDRGD